MGEKKIHNKESFLKNISLQLGRSKPVQVERPVWKHQPQWEVHKGASKQELVEILKKQCMLNHTDFYETDSDHLTELIEDTIGKYEGKSAAVWEDPRFDEYGITEYFNEKCSDGTFSYHRWDPKLGEQNIVLTEKADVGITFSDMTLAESGTVVLMSGNGKGRSISLLPVTYIAIIPKSTIVPRMSQATREIHQKIEKGEKVVSCVNFISGPSNSADIEMNLVVGVHGPIKATYIVVADK